MEATKELGIVMILHAFFFEKSFVHFFHLPYAHTYISFSLTNIIPIFHVNLPFTCLMPLPKTSDNLIDFSINIIWCLEA